jgi:hypothetical protein
MRLPARCRDEAHDDTPLVDTFRIVFSCLENRPAELVEHRAFLWRWPDRFNIEEIPTRRLQAEE